MITTTQVRRQKKDKRDKQKRLSRVRWECDVSGLLIQYEAKRNSRPGVRSDPVRVLGACSGARSHAHAAPRIVPGLHQLRTRTYPGTVHTWVPTSLFVCLFLRDKQGCKVNPEAFPAPRRTLIVEGAKECDWFRAAGGRRDVCACVFVCLFVCCV